MPTPTLDDLLPRLRKLDQARTEAKELRRKALADLTKKPYEAQQPGWPELGDNVEHALMLDAIRTAVRCQFDLGGFSREIEKFALAKLGNVRLRDLIDDDDGPTPNLASDTESDNVPVLRAARMMRALVSTPGQGLHSVTLRCYYRIVRELYTPDPPDWSIGGASAGRRGPASAFLTGECARAVNAFARALERTGDFFEIIGTFRANLRVIADERIPAAWRDRERERLEISTSIDLARLVPDIVIRIDDPPKPRGVESYILSLTDGMRAAIEHGRSAITGVIAEAAEHVPLDPLDAGAHGMALKVLDDALDHLKHVADHLSGEMEPAWHDLGEDCRKFGQAVRAVLRPAIYFLKSIQAQQLSRAARKPGSVDAAELAFSTAALGSLTNRWDYEGTAAAVQVLQRAIDDGGTFSTQLPIVVDLKGFKLLTVNAEVVRAVAKILTHVPEQVDPDSARKLIQLLADTRCKEETGGWSHEGALERDEASWWMTALAFFASNRIVRMLDRAINAQVFVHFTVTPYDKLKLDLEDLFYTDYGICSSHPNRRASGAILLQRLRASLVGVPPPDSGSAIASVVLHGPPGTGKTTLLEALAKSAEKNYLTVTPGDILAGGAEELERRARSVFEALSMLTDAVVLFDEFDPIVWKRDPAAGTPATVFEFLTAGMLPKLKALHDAAEKNRLVFALATNIVGSLDPAVIREGRFDEKIGIYPPDLVSRAGRLWTQVLRFRTKSNPDDCTGGWEERIADAVARTKGGPMNSLGKPGWFTAPKGIVQPRTVFAFVLQDTEGPLWPKSEAGTPKPPPMEAEGAAADAARQGWSEWAWVVEWEDRLAGTDSAALTVALREPPPDSPKRSSSGRANS